MFDAESQRLTYEADDARITSIRGVDMPEGVLYTPVHVAETSRTLSPLAVQMINGIFDWADESRSRD